MRVVGDSDRLYTCERERERERALEWNKLIMHRSSDQSVD